MGLAPRLRQDVWHEPGPGGDDGLRPHAHLDGGIILAAAGQAEVIFPSTRILERIEGNPFLKDELEGELEAILAVMGENLPFAIYRSALLEELPVELRNLFKLLIPNQYIATWDLWEAYKLLIEDNALTYSKYRRALIEDYYGIRTAENSVFYHLTNYMDEPARLYKDRTSRRIDAPSFLRTNYARRLFLGDLTLAELRTLDPNLWRALRNFAHHHKFDVGDILPRGSAKPGRKPLQGTPDEVAEHRREMARARLRRHRERKRDPKIG